MAKKIQLAEGSVYAIPVPRVGFFPVTVTRVPEVRTQERTVFVYIDGTARASAEECARVGALPTWEEAWLGFCTPKPFELGRWPRVGAIKDFKPADWPVPPAIEEDEEAGWRCTALFADDGTMRLVANVAEPWPSARVRLIQHASAFEKALAHRAAGRKPGFWDMEAEFLPATQRDIDEWVCARKAIDKLAETHPVLPPCTRQIEEGDLISVPLDCGGFGVVLAARVEPRNRGSQSFVLLGLPVFTDWPPDADACQHVLPEDMISIWNSESVGVRYGDWTVIGRLGSFSREVFCVPFYTEFFGHRSVDPFPARTHRWRGREFRIESPNDIPMTFVPELRRNFTLTTSGGVRGDLSAYHRGVRYREIGEYYRFLTPDHAPLWREMAAWAEREADGQA